MPNQLWLPDVIADAFRGISGYRVETMSGWNTRGRDNFNPIGVMNHHTGGGGYDALLNFMAHGSSIAPLCNIATSRPQNGVVRITIVEAGRANHAGRGYLPWIGTNNGNYRTIGIENQNNGSEPWPQQQVEGIHILSAALLDKLGANTDRLVDHKTYAPGRKPDRHSVDINDTRREVIRIMDSGFTARDYIQRGDTGPEVREWQESLLQWNSDALPEYGADSDFGNETVLWTNRFFRQAGISDGWVSDPKVGPGVITKMNEMLGNSPAPKEPDYKVVVLYDPSAQVDEGMARVYGKANQLKQLPWPTDATFETAFVVGKAAQQADAIKRHIRDSGFTPNVITFAGSDRDETAKLVKESIELGFRKHPGVDY